MPADLGSPLGSKTPTGVYEGLLAILRACGRRESGKWKKELCIFYDHLCLSENSKLWISNSGST